MRPSWDHYFMAIARQVATRATCDRKLVGAVLVRDRQILSTGYNGSPRNLPHCDEAGHLLVDVGWRQSCFRTVHAEANAVAQAARVGVRVEGATAYVTVTPCPDCAKLLINAGITRVVIGGEYDSKATVFDSVTLLVEAKVAVDRVFDMLDPEPAVP